MMQLLNKFRTLGSNDNDDLMTIFNQTNRFKPILTVNLK